MAVAAKAPPKGKIRKLRPKWRLPKTERHQALEALWTDVVAEGAARAPFKISPLPEGVTQFQGAAPSSRIVCLRWAILQTDNAYARSQLMALLSLELSR